MAIWLACDGFLNWGKYCNPKFDDLLARARGVTDVAQRQALYKQLVDIYLADRPHIVLYHAKWLWALSDKVSGFTPTPDGLIRPQGMTARTMTSSASTATGCLAICTRCAKIGEYKTGVHRPTYSPRTCSRATGWPRGMTEAGLEPEIDGIGNVIGRARGDGPKLLLGSHVETQPHAGWLDGALGVIYGLEVARTLGGGIDVAAWADEEGHFGSFIGSRSFCGLLPDAEIDTCRNRDGTTLRDALAAGGVRRAAARTWSIPRAIAATSRRISSRAPNWRTPAGASASSPPSSAAIASASCSRACRTTPAPRAWRSARMPVWRWCSWPTRSTGGFPQVAGPRTVWTTGRITLDPGAASIVPGRAEMLFQFRDTDPALLAKLERELEALVAEANARSLRR